MNTAKTWLKKAIVFLVVAAMAITLFPFTGLKMVTKAEEEPKSLFAETDLYSATVSYGENAGIPEGAYLVLTELSEYSPEFEKAKEAIINDDNGLNEGNLGMAAFDLTIYDAEGYPIEPSEAIQVNIQMKSLPENADKAELESTMAIQHLDESSGEVLVDTVATVVADENGDIVVEEDAVAAEFTVESFSTFVLTWKTGSAPIQWGYLDGATFKEMDDEELTALDTTAATVSLDNAYEGYYSMGATYYPDDTLQNGVDITYTL